MLKKTLTAIITATALFGLNANTFAYDTGKFFQTDYDIVFKQDSDINIFEFDFEPPKFNLDNLNINIVR